MTTHKYKHLDDTVGYSNMEQQIRQYTLGGLEAAGFSLYLHLKLHQIQMGTKISTPTLQKYPVSIYQGEHTIYDPTDIYIISY